MAIAIDSTSTAFSATNVTSLTWAHTCTGANLVLTVSIDTEQNDAVTGVTYNGVAMTLAVDKDALAADGYVSVWYLANPTTGTNNIIASFNSSRIAASAISFSGANPISPLGQTAKNTAGGSGTTDTLSITTLFANSYLVDSSTRLVNASALAATGTNQTLLFDKDLSTIEYAGSYTPTTTVGSYTMSYSWTTSVAGRSFVIAEIREKTTSGNPAFLLNFV